MNGTKIKRICMGLAGWSVVLFVTAAPQRNVVFILVDDLGCTDLGYAGSTFHETPNIDALAASGMRFDQGYAACQVCSP